ncbi:penicillin-binding transpeptidase domain-containing protein [Brevibacterium daeguense]|uniref:Penicillin-binding transpeptidase domain-containing protein n=1 Tax=Brevibacterium daeguense TaxID=909936 RepID=A0ABP8EF46_9MICO|nr:penicillin-binding protein 2 [Brevibacterium daeguense]
MNKPLRHVALVGFVMFALLFGSTSWIQYFQAENLREHELNNRTLIEELSRERGPILVDGTPIAYSVPVDDVYEFQRTYGADGMSPEMYANITGFFSVTNGATNLEKTENSLLAGTDDALFYDKITNWLTGRQPMGAAIEITVDPAAQKAAWDALGGQKGAAVALDPKTGDVLAMVSTPGWDPNALATHDHSAAQDAYDRLIADEDNPAYNRAIGGNLYPPGSTFKIVTAAAALESGEYEPDTMLDGPAELDLPQTTATIRNSGGGACGSGTISLADSLRISCNTSFADLGMTLGQDAMETQAREFGFGEDMEIPLRVSASSFPADTNPPQLAQSALGQFEVRSTPLQMAMVSAAIANDGKLMHPQLIDQVRNARTLDLIEEPSPREFSRPVSGETAQELTDMMVSVVTDGTGSAGQIPGIDVAAKTGTAQHAEGAAPHAWYTSFAPADDPQVAVAVVVESGGRAGSEAYGGSTAGPIAKAVMEAVIKE